VSSRIVLRALFFAHCNIGALYHAFTSCEACYNSAFSPPGIRQHSAFVGIRRHSSAFVGIRRHSSAFVNIRQHSATSAVCVAEADSWMCWLDVLAGCIGWMLWNVTAPFRQLVSGGGHGLVDSWLGPPTALLLTA
jgi:hypothetical protein